MNKPIDLIEKWSKAFSLPVNTQFTIPSKSDFEAHCSHIIEESKELLKAMEEDNHEQILDGAGDIFWVTVRLNMLLGIPAHYYMSSNFKHRENFSDLSVEVVRNTVKIIHDRLNSVIFTYHRLIEENTVWTGEDVEAMLWSLNRYVMYLLNYLCIDLDKLIPIIYESNMSKLCTLTVAEESCKALLTEKSIVARPYLSPIWKTLEKPRFVGDLKKYYIAEASGRIRKPLTFLEPNFNLY